MEKDQTKQEIGSDEGERELLLKERESLLLQGGMGATNTACTG